MLVNKTFTVTTIVVSYYGGKWRQKILKWVAKAREPIAKLLRKYLKRRVYKTESKVKIKLGIILTIQNHYLQSSSFYRYGIVKLKMPGPGSKVA